ncbi:MAG: DEAD/DEAH box helicase, partial [Chitinophagia bacterium]|nr:DEAD/DEAH box helicase [Chitinophagia bacterium]
MLALFLLIFQSENILDSPIEFLKGVGPQRAELLQAELDIAVFGDLLQHFPYRYYDRTTITPIGSITPDMEFVQCAGTLINMAEEGDFRKRRLVATLFDQTGRIELVWFQGVTWLKKHLREGDKYVIFGKVASFNGQVNISHPEIEPLNAETTQPGLQPMYPTTEKLRQRGITNRTFGKLTAALFDKITAREIPEIIPGNLLATNNLFGRYEAYRQIHFPDSTAHSELARRRLVWEELLLSQLKIGRLRLQHQVQRGWPFPVVGEHFNRFYADFLPFPLTGAQKRVIKEIRADLSSGKQMNRLLQGDVGSGKTIVALMVMLLALDNGFQACIMAPTEILARQHFAGISSMLEGTGLEIGLLTGTVKGKERKAVLQGLADNSLQIVAGTHALLEEKVRFLNLGLAV